MVKKKRLIIAIYSHPEYYPPTLSAIEYLSNIYDEIILIHRNITGFDWVYPPNVKLCCKGEILHVREAERQSLRNKIRSFFDFTVEFWRLCRINNPQAVLIYDYMPMLSYYLIRFFIKPPGVFWYHNHDVAEKKYLRKWSLSWFAWKCEWLLFSKIDIFSLPSNERKLYFPMEKLKGKYYFLPNYPAKIIYDRFGAPNQVLKKEIRLLYQGSIDSMHGLEEIIDVLDMEIGGHKLILVLKGFINENYKFELFTRAKNMGVEDRIVFIAPSGYKEVIANARTCNIGIGIHKKDDIMNKTLGTASNKLYEYAASGMPVIVYDNLHFRNALKGRKWIYYTDTSRESIIMCLNNIIIHYQELSKSAISDFRDELCFENYFKETENYLLDVNSKN